MNARIKVSGLAALVLGLALGACERAPQTEDRLTGDVTAEETRASRSGWPAGAGAQLDSGNAAYSAKDYEQALRHYDAIIALPGAPDNLKVTGYFGLYMTRSAMGDVAGARAASEKLEELTGDATLTHGNPMMMDSTQVPPTTPDDSIHRGGGQ